MSYFYIIILILILPPSDSLLTRWPLKWVIASVKPQFGSKSMNYDISLIFIIIISTIVIILTP